MATHRSTTTRRTLHYYWQVTRKHFGLFAAYAEGDGPVSSAVTREQLGWQPTDPGLLSDLDRPEYFQP